MRVLDRKSWPVWVFLAFASAAAFWQWVVTADAVSYGTSNKTFFKLGSDPDDQFALLRRERNQPVQVTEGDEFEICFHDITWYRLCAGTLTTHLTPSFGPRYDFPIYTINTPRKAGPVDPKCRKITAPTLTGRAGPFMFNGYARFHCKLDGAPDVVLPTLKLDIIKK